jgi:HAD superfamily hydrolase (TIGR01509 family)
MGAVWRRELMPRVRRDVYAAVFDCDGLLVDSSPVWARAFDVVAAELGHELTGDQHRRLLGASVDSAAIMIARWLGARGQAGPLAQAIHRALHRALDAEPVSALAGARELVERIASRIPMAVASNAKRDVIERMLSGAGFPIEAAAIVTADDVPYGKPHPAVYLAACSAIGVEPTDATAFEDSLTGARAALSASMNLVFVQPAVAALPDALRRPAGICLWSIHASSLVASEIATLRFRDIAARSAPQSGTAR